MQPPRFPTIRPNERESGRASFVIDDVTASQKRPRWPPKISTFAKSDAFLRSALQQPQIEIDINSTFVLDANNEVWELNSHELGFSVPNTSKINVLIPCAVTVQARQIFIWLKHITLGYGTAAEVSGCFVKVMCLKYIQNLVTSSANCVT